MAGMDTGWAACSRCDHNLVRIFFVGGWDGMALGMLGIHVTVGAFAGYLIETVFRLLKRQIRRRSDMCRLK
ncbi:YesK family protein [Bacillus halotolerans]|uniref:YesK family protein n=1 Tax=Bacillus halotolerans TaxID=260554 RepID=UPI002E0F8B96